MVISGTLLGYFVGVFLGLRNTNISLNSYGNSIPYFYERYADTLLSYQLLRERMINSRNLSKTYDYEDPDIEQYYFNKSLTIE